MARLEVQAERLEQGLENVEEFGRDPGGAGITRLALTEADAWARHYVKRELRALGLEVWHDEVGNLFGRRAGREADAPCVMTGSHLDSVPRGGRLDGPYGVLGALEALRAIDAAAIETRRPIEVAVFVAEEGSRFRRGTIGSAALTGELAAAEALALRDADGVAFRQALASYADEGAPRPARRAAGALHAFVELHIEQGGVLEERAVPIGAVTAVRGLLQHTVRFEGEANHAGATPMNLRRDALAAAAEATLAVERIARELGEGAVATVGRLDVEPGVFNIVPGAAAIAIDARAPRPELLAALDDRIQAACKEIAERRRVRAGIQPRQRLAPAACDERVIGAVERAAAACQLGSLRLPSGAVHDALHLAACCPSGMIFVPSKGGRSHCPEEETSMQQLVQGVSVLAHALVELANG